MNITTPRAPQTPTAEQPPCDSPALPRNDSRSLHGWPKITISHHWPPRPLLPSLPSPLAFIKQIVANIRFPWLVLGAAPTSTPTPTPTSTSAPAPAPVTIPLPAGTILPGNRGKKPGPRFETNDKAAQYAHQLLGSETLKRDQEFGGLLMVNTAGQYRITAPAAGCRHSVNVAAGSPSDKTGQPVIPPGYKISGMYHSHPVKSVDTADSSEAERNLNFYSHPDLKAAVLLNIDSYLFLPDGAILKFSPARIPSAHLLRQVLTADRETAMQFEQLLDPTQRVNLLASVGAIEVTQPGKLWSTPGVVPVG